MRRVLLLLIMFVGLNLFFIFRINAETVIAQDAQPQLPQSEAESNDPQTQLQTSSTLVYSEDNTRSFLKGVAVGSVVGLVVGGVVVWFYKRRIN